LSTFAVTVKSIRAIEAHPKADRLELAFVEGYQMVVPKGKHRPGEVIAYIPEGAICPEFVLRTIGLWDEVLGKGRCGGDTGDKVCTTDLRGQMSQGLCYPLAYLDAHPFGAGWYLQDAESNLWPVKEGDDVTGQLRVKKFTPDIPAEFTGEIFFTDNECLPKFEVEDIKRYPHVIQPGEEVEFSEKIHGLSTIAALVPKRFARNGSRLYVASKTLAHDRYSFEVTPENRGSIYVDVAYELELERRLLELEKLLGTQDKPVWCLGEIFGPGIQDLGYGQRRQYRAFDFGAGFRNFEDFVNAPRRGEVAAELGLQSVPSLYKGQFSKEVLAEYTEGKETVSGASLHVREGVIVRPAVERREIRFGRAIVKSVSNGYLKRGGKRTEYQ
jgi:RNA ligase (TIGR02306 family)